MNVIILEISVLCKKKNILWFKNFIQQLLDKDGHLKYVFGVWIDSGNVYDNADTGT